MGELATARGKSGGVETAGEMARERFELSDELERFGLGRLRGEPAPEIRHGFDEIDIRPAAQIGGTVCARPVLQPKARQRLKCRPRSGADHPATGRRWDRPAAPVRSGAA